MRTLVVPMMALTREKPFLSRHGKAKGRVDVRFGSLADILLRPCHVRFTPNNGHWPAQVSIWLSVYEYTP